VVISDWDMPIISGMELWDFIRGGQCGVVEFILMCSTTNRARIDEVRKSGIKYFLKKPFSTAQLEQRLSAAIDYTAARNMAM
jgi:FixJ family two-component response regulator